jgi:hypothetical protein
MSLKSFPLSGTTTTATTSTTTTTSTTLTIITNNTNTTKWEKEGGRLCITTLLYVMSVGHRP